LPTEKSDSYRIDTIRFSFLYPDILSLK